MRPPRTSVSHGVLHSLIDKLEKLSSSENGLRDVEKRKILDLKNTLKKFIDTYHTTSTRSQASASGVSGLCRLSPGPLPPESQASAAPTGTFWVKEVRNLSYDIDDFIDRLVHTIDYQRNPRRMVSPIFKLRECLNRRRWIVKEVSRFRACLKEAVQWRQPATVATSVDPPVPPSTAASDGDPVDPDPWYEMVPAHLVGIESSVSKIGGWLTEEGEDQHLRVISLVGSGGVGKTTLARQLYDRFGTQFHCQAFVQSSQKPDMKRLFTSILRQIHPYCPPDAFQSCNLIVDMIRERLHHKKYLIIIDDIWASSTWDIIYHALPDDNCSSRILTTTELDLVSQRCCGHNSKHIFEMKPLRDEQSKQLFISVVTGRKCEDPVELNKVPYEVIRKCGGFPLATIAVASLFPRQRDIDRVDWDKIWKSVCSSFEANPDIDGMQQLLVLCYNLLPDYLKACMLYLSMYEEDHIIRKDDLLRQWITEGFICEEERNQDMAKVASNYFYELVNRGMIQAVDTKYNGEVLFCRVHYMVLNVIRYMATEENFVTAIDHSAASIRHLGKVRRLSLRLDVAEDADPSKKLELSHLRSLVFFGYLKCLPCIEVYQLLRILIIHLWSEEENKSFDLTTVCKLFRLTYLEISCNTTLNLQSQLRGLQCLETLKVDCRVTQLPLDIVDLPCLSHLTIPGDTELANDIGQMTSLETLECFDLSQNSSENVERLSTLKNLWDLRLTCSMVPCDKLEQNIRTFGKIVLPAYENLKALFLLPAQRSSSLNTLASSSSNNHNISFEVLSKASSLPKCLERLELSPRICIFNSFPVGIKALSELRILKVAVLELCQKDVNDLEQLSDLTSLSLYVRALEKRIVFNRFKSLKHFKFICSALRIEIAEGAMSNVKRLKLGFRASTVKDYSPEDSGFQHMTGLQVISAKVGTADDDKNHRAAAQSMLEAIFGQRKVDVQWVDSIFLGHQGKTTEAQKGEHQNPEKPPVITNEGAAEQHGNGGRKASDEDTKRIADTRTNVSTRPDSKMQIPGMKASIPAENNNVHGQTRLIMKYATRQLLKLKGFHMKTELESIRRERELMSIIIDKNSGNDSWALPERWVIQLQDLAYDIEDFTDVYDLMNDISSKVKSKSMRIKWRARILAHLSQIVPLKHRLESLQKWQQGPIYQSCTYPWTTAYGGGTTSSSISDGFYPFVPLVLDELVGMDEPMTELASLVVSDMHPEPLAVISITGCRGAGKTTLAAIVYHNNLVLNHFDLRAWVVASDCNSAGEFLETIAQQEVYGQRYMQGTHVIRNKRCLVVIDGIQQAQLWYNIQGALTQMGPGSRIIITTSIQSVATKCIQSVPTKCIKSDATKCSPEKYIYRLRGHDSEMSKKLVWRKVESRVNHTPVLDDALEGTLEKCDGLPLALVDVANYFRAKGQNLHQLELGPEVFEGVNRVLTDCYDSLPDHYHRACLLSLSMFTDGHRIKRKNLIRTWIAEGLVMGDSTHTVEQVAGDCFDELVDRNLIEPVLIGNNSKVKTCRVRGFMLDFIINKAVSKGFVTLIRDNKLIHKKEGSCTHRVRRLSVHGSTAESTNVTAAIGLSHVRSLTVQNGELFDLMSCKLVRVLNLERYKGDGNWALRCICKLIMLKYLSLRGSDVDQIPKKIRKLQCLETLDLRATQVKKLCVDVIMLPRLAHLFGRFALPPEFNDKKMKHKLEACLSEKSALQTLSGFSIDDNRGFELILQHMRLLRKVKIWCENSITTDTERDLAYSLRKSISGDNGIESLSIDFGDKPINFLDSVLLEGPSRLSSIKLHGRLSKLPNFMALLDNMSELELSFTLLSIEDLSALQHFRRLLYLKLVKGPRAFWGGRFIVQNGGFPSLQRLCFEAPELPEVQIQEGGMSAVTSLHLLCPEFALCSKFSGIKHLKYLNEVVFHPDVGDEELAGWKDEAMGHQNRPKVYKHGSHLTSA